MTTFFGTNGPDLRTGGSGNDDTYGWPADGDENTDVGNDTLRGADGNDTIFGGGGRDRLGRFGNDLEEGNDSISGGSGTDEVDGGNGNDTLLGGADDDFLLSAEFGDSIDGGTGRDEWIWWNAAATAATTATWDGTPGAVNVFSDGSATTTVQNVELVTAALGSGSDVVSMAIFPGFVALRGGGGNDSLTGGDTLNASPGSSFRDRLSGESGNDTLIGGGGDDVLGQGSFNVRFRLFDIFEPGVIQTVSVTEEGNDSLVGGEGNDTIDGGIGNDTLLGGPGIDALRTAGLGDSVDGGTGQERWTWDAALETAALTGTWDAAPGATTVFSNGATTTTVKNVEYVSALLGSGDDHVSVAALFDLGDGFTFTGVELSGNAGHDFLTGSATQTNTLLGGTGNDTLIGGSGDDFLGRRFSDAGEGDNSIVGGSGNDRLDGGVGNDTLLGGPGEDRLAGGADDDRFEVTVAEFAIGESIDGGLGVDWLVVRDGGVFDMGMAGTSVAGIERVGLSAATNFTANNLAGLRVFGSGAGDKITLGSVGQIAAGGGGKDSLLGGSANDTIEGGAGADKMHGQGGNDRFVVTVADFAGDTIEGGTGAADLLYVTGGGVFDMTAGIVTGVERAAMAVATNFTANGLGGLTVYGSGAGDTITLGNANQIATGGGGDSLVGGSGNDTIEGGSGADNMHGGGGNDRFVVTAAEFAGDTIEGGGGVDLLYVTGGSVFDMNAGAVTGIERAAMSAASTFTANNLAGLIVYGSGFGDSVTLGNSGQTARAGDGNDRVAGGGGNDLLLGDAGADRLTGGIGRDTLQGGAAGDTYVYLSVLDSPVGAGRDSIQTWDVPDVIDLAAIDANTSAGGDQDFLLLSQTPGTPDNTVGQGQLKYYWSGGDTFVVGGVDADTVADFQIRIAGEQTLTISDFSGVHL